MSNSLTDPAKLSNANGAKIVQEAISFFDISSAAEEKNRRTGLAALKFYQGGENQWDAAMYKNRGQDGRPCDSYNQIPNFVNQVVNDGRMNMAQTAFSPNEDGDKETAEALEDLARDIQQDSDAEIAYDNALFGQSVPGWGYWRYVTQYESDTSFDKIIKILPIWNPFTVYDDPYAVQVDKLDRKRLLQVSDVKLGDFNTRYGKDYDQSTIESIGDSSPKWATSDSVRVAEFWKVTETSSTIYRHKKTGEIAKTTPKDPNNYDSREVMKPSVMWYMLTGKEVLQSKKWDGIYIPYVKVVGRELNINGEVHLSGLVERLMPAQRLNNYTINGMVETAALAPKTPFIADPEAIGGEYQKYWDQANVRNFAYLPYKSKDAEGNPIPPPQRANNSADLASWVALTQQSQQAFYNLSGIFPASLGQASNEKSGKAILARQKEGDVATFDIHDNLARGHRAGGRILADLIPKTYDGARKVKGRKEDGKTYLMTINQKFKAKDGEAKEYDLTKGSYGVAVTTGPSFTTKRTESSEAMLQVLQTPIGESIAQVGADLVIRSQDWPGADKLADRLNMAMPPQFQEPKADEEGDDQAKIPPQVMAQMQQMQQMQQQQAEMEQVIQQQQAELQQANQAVESKQGEMQLKQAELQLKAQDMQLKAQNEAQKLDIERGKLQLEARQQEIDMMAAQPDPQREQKEQQEGADMQGFLAQLSESLMQGFQGIAQVQSDTSQAIIESNQQIAAAIVAPKQITAPDGRVYSATAQ